MALRQGGDEAPANTTIELQQPLNPPLHHPPNPRLYNPCVKLFSIVFSISCVSMFIFATLQLCSGDSKFCKTVTLGFRISWWIFIGIIALAFVSAGLYEMFRWVKRRFCPQ